MLKDLVKQNRSCRRFYQDQRLEEKTLRDLVNLARMSASGANRQPLKYILSVNEEENDRIFPCLAWAAYLKDWKGPAPGERPAAYIVILGDMTIADDVGCDHGIAGQSILLGAREQGLAGCMIGSIDKKALREVLAIPQQYKVLLVLAIGRPKEEAVLETVDSDGSIKYWRDDNMIHHVPKRKLEDIIISPK